MKVSKLIIIVLSIVILLSFIPIINYYININSKTNKSVSFSTGDTNTGDISVGVYDTLFNELSFGDDYRAINVNYVLHNNEVPEPKINVSLLENEIKLTGPNNMYSIRLYPDNTYNTGGAPNNPYEILNSEFTINYTIDTNVNKLLPLISFIVVIIGITTIVYYIKFD